MASQRLHHSTCPLCEAGCGIVVETKGSEILSIRGDKVDPASRGFICPKVMGMADLHTDPDRLRSPVKRVGDHFEPVSWKQAFEDIGRRVRELRKNHGPDSIGVYQGNPTVHNLGLLVFGQLLFRSLKTRNLFSATSTDQLPHMLASLKMFGEQVLLPVPDIDRSDLIVMLGANPVVSGGSLMTAPGFAKRVSAMRVRGGELVVVDPRRTETAEIADRHLAIRPGTDALFLFAMIDVVFSEGLSRIGRLEEHVRGVTELASAASRFPADRVAEAVGIEAETIRKLARQIASTPRALVYGRIGVCQQPFAALATWLINALNATCGHLDEVGGLMFASPAVDLIKMAKLMRVRGSHGKYRSRSSNLPEFGGELPVAALAEEIELPGDRQIRALITSAGNPVLSAPNGPRIERALRRLELMVSIDFYVNETTCHADYILPPTSVLEREHYDLAFAVLMVRNHAKFSRPVFERPDGALHDWEICVELSREIFGSGWKRPLGSLLSALAKAGGPRAVVAAGLATGPYRLRLGAVESSRHGLDLGALESRLPEALVRRDGGRFIDLAPEIYLADLDRLDADLDSRRLPTGLVLVGRRQLRSNNSWMHNCRRLVKGKPRCTLLIHPDDAADRGLTSGAMARLTSRVGSIEAPVEISDEMMKGVVSLPHGWGHHREGSSMQIAKEHAGVSVNDITDETAVDPISGNAAFNGISVEVACASALAENVA